MNLLIVESPHKAYTIDAILKEEASCVGRWIVRATKGHIEDIPKKEFGITKRNGHYDGDWIVDDAKKDIIKEIAQLATQAENVFVATDNDREGEKITADIVNRAKLKKYERITFKEITKRALLEAINEGARPVDKARVESQKARRYIDRIIGYVLSPAMAYDFQKNESKYIPNGTGRVLAASLSLIAQNERTRRDFTPEKYYQLSVTYETISGEQFKLVLERKFAPEQKSEMEDVMRYIKERPHFVSRYEPDTNEVPPPPPLTTSLLQRAAFYDEGLHFTPKKTMELAQKLYEAGLITYMRVDKQASLSEEIVVDIISALLTVFHEKHILAHKRHYKAKQEGHDAHEAIRPISFAPDFYPRNVMQTKEWQRAQLTSEHHLLYKLIWFRTAMTQMNNAFYDTSKIEVTCSEVRFKGAAQMLLTDEHGEPRLGWLHIHRNVLKQNDPDFIEKERYIPQCRAGDPLKVLEIEQIERTTKTPDRYGEGRFITTLENLGIGRPSTFATIIPTMVEKGYARSNKGYLECLPLGEAVDQWCKKNCEWLTDAKHAAEFEHSLDLIEKGEIESADELIREYDELVGKVCAAIGFTPSHERGASEAQRNLALKLAAEKGANLDESFFDSADKVSKYINTNMPNYQKLGSCPACKKGDVVEKENTNKETGEIHKRYCCTDRNCTFVIWDKSIIKFLERYKRDSDGDERKSIVSGCLKKKSGYEVAGFRKAANNEIYTANLGIKKDQTYGWGIGFLERKK